MSRKRRTHRKISGHPWSQPIPKGKKVHPSLFLDYYLHAFALFHQQLEQEGYSPEIQHPIRRRFWELLPYRSYEPFEARKLVLSYIDSIESTIADTVRRNSLAYWLHLYRRLFPSSIGSDKRPMTAGLVRAILEAAIQKYAQLEPCRRIGITGDVPLDKVLGGLLMAPQFELERQGLQSGRQLVLTDFTSIELREFYDVERLAYELLRGTSLLRIIGKGTSIAVDDSDEAVYDLRSDELDKLVRILDERNEKWERSLLSSTGMVGDKTSMDSERGIIFLPIYNLSRIKFEELGPFFSAFHFNIRPFDSMAAPNFMWVPFSLRQYRIAHLPFAQAFNAKYGVELDAILLVVAALCLRVYYMWREAEYSLLRFFQRAYEGPYLFEDIVDEIKAFVPAAKSLLGLDGSVERLDILKAVQFWSINGARRSSLDLAYPGPHSIFLPYNQERVFIDYAWILRRLYDMFVGVSIPDQNFKGEALEHLVRFKSSALPIKQCEATDGSARQIDAAFSIGTRLVIVECRAVGKSIGFDRGDPDAIRYRTGIVEKSLKDIDEKAAWLVRHPIGENYNITHYSDILPIGVTPFAEFIPSLRSYYWLTETLPRVLTPSEIKTALEDSTLSRVTANLIHLND